MKCPKCSYLSFEPEPRCKNCGYGFSLAETEIQSPAPPAATSSIADIELRTAFVRPANPGIDAPVREPSMRRAAIEAPLQPSRSASAASSVSLLDDPADLPVTATRPPSSPAAVPAPPRPPRPVSARPPAAPQTGELPLFVKGLSIPAPETVQKPNPLSLLAEPVRVPDPEPPVAKRKAEPATERPRSNHPAVRRVGPLDRDLLQDLDRLEQIERKEAKVRAAVPLRADRPGAVKRLVAAAIDAALLGGLSSGVVALTLRWCGLSWEQAAVLPVAPVVAFLLLLGAAYLVMFTAAGGQTVGKMALGIRVVGDAVEGGENADTLTIQQAAYRGCLTLPSVLAFGLGFIPGLVGQERAIHDRLTHTRVVRA